MDDGTKCAFRWSKETYDSYSYLRIDCLVVDADITESSSINWDNEKVVTRKFKGAGYIGSFLNKWNYSERNRYGTVLLSYDFYTARPLEWGYYDYTFIKNPYSINDSYVSIEQTQSLMNYGGYYWTSDADQTIFSMVFNNSTGLELGYKFANFDKANAVNIRCVKDE